ncbi:MAG: MFS transporter [Gemmatimonadaceae bacterium]|nr:MFS transporter [Gemmatimonadaceae bacterium]
MTGPPAEGPPSPYLQVGLLFVCEALTRTSAVILLTTMGLAGSRLTPDPSLTTLPLALVPVATTLTTIPAAHWMRRHGRRTGFLTGGGLGVAGAAVAAAAAWHGEFLLLCAGALLIGTVNGFATYYRFAAAEVSPPAFRSRAISLVMAGGVIAAVAGATMAAETRFLWEGREFAGSFGCIVVLQALILLVMSFTRLPPPTPRSEAGGGRPLTRIAAHPTFRMALLGGVASWGLMSLLMNATPLSMERHHHAFHDTARVIQWHVLGMYVPSFFTGSIVQRVGERPVMFAGILLIGVSALVNLGGTEVAWYMTGLTLLGVGWNFLFVSCTSLLTGTYSGEGEKTRVQSANDFLIFATMILSSFSSGALEARIGWYQLNLAALAATALVAATLAGLAWRERRLAGEEARHAAPEPR